MFSETKEMLKYYDKNMLLDEHGGIVKSEIFDYF